MAALSAILAILSQGTGTLSDMANSYVIAIMSTNRNKQDHPNGR